MRNCQGHKLFISGIEERWFQGAKLTLNTPKRALCFGLPGTGKTTFVRDSARNPLYLDLGHNAFKSDKERARFYRKCVKHTTSELDLFSKNKEVSFLYDAYPEYFDATEVRKVSDLVVIFAIPSVETMERTIVPRVFSRDGTTEFPMLYAKKWKEWHKDWIHTYYTWRGLMGNKRVWILPTYDSVEWIRTWKC